jgi:phage tail sheath protein FI
MPEYLYPGVYVEEVNTGNEPIEGVSTSTAGFLGVAERGPTAATFVSSFPEFQRSFGTYLDSDPSGNPTYLAYAVEGFFLNGGLRCYIARVTSGTAKPATATSGPFIISAAGPGMSGNNIAYLIRTATIAPTDTTKFRLTLYYWASAADAKKAAVDPISGQLLPAPTQVEDFDNLSTNPSNSMYYVGVITDGSNLVTIAPSGAAGNPVYAAAYVFLTGAGDGAALTLTDFEGVNVNNTNNPTSTSSTGLAALAAVDEISLLTCPDEHYAGIALNAIALQLQTTCETMKDRFAILNSLVNAGVPSKLQPSLYSEYAAFYYPWLNVVNPNTNLITLVPPCGHMAGIYARSDNDENVAKDPANEQILGIDSLQIPINNQLQAILNPQGVNCLRYFKGLGNLVWGGRTTASDPDWQYISVRRLFIFIEKSIQQGTQWVVFQPNDAVTWARVVRSVSDFLTGLWMQNMLMGATKDKAFFVRCDNTTMTQTDIQSGRLIALVGVAPVYPAEFVIFRIGQWAGGSSVTEG